MPQARNRIDYAVVLGAVMALVLITPNNVLANRAVPPGMVFIPGGEFEMGCHEETGEECIGDELPVHLVYISPFYMDVYEVTNEQYCAYLNSAYSQGSIDVIDGVVYQADGGEPYCNTYSARDDSHIHWDGSAFAVVSGKHNHPMMLVSWYGAVAYANWCSAQQGRTPCYSLSSWICDFDANGYRLPTEAEWEYASRGGNRDPYYAYPWGNTIDGSNANYHLSGDPYETGPIPWTTPAGYYAPNGYGLYDVSGNVFEWCNDWRAGDYYGSSPYSDPRGPSSGTTRVLRGGSWSNYEDDLRCAARNAQFPDVTHYNNVGFRLALQSNGGLEEGLVGHWCFDEGSGSTVSDSSGSGYEGTIHGPTWVGGVVGTALNFDGIDDYVEIDADLSLHHHPGQISVAGWVQVLAVDTDEHSQTRQPILAKGLYPEWEYALYVWDNMDAGINVWQGSGGAHSNARGGDLVFANWHHVVGTYCHGITRVYVDGSCVAIGTDPSGEVFDGARPIRIGSREDNQFLNAIIDEIRVYAKAISDEEVERLYGGRPLAIGVHQRADASKLVDVTYSLSGFGDQSYSVTLQISDDGGNTWTLEPTAVWGDVGEGVVPGDDKHIIWNPSVDLPGIGGSNFKVRLTSDVPYFGESSVFSITPAGPGDLIGTVRGQATGDPIIGADVSVNGEPPVQTDEYGQFFSSDVPAGQATIDVTATGYYTLSQTVQIREESFTDVNVLLTPDTGFGVVSVHGQYCNPGTHVYYLNGVNLTEIFTATIDWGGHGAGEVHWITPGNTYIDDCSGGATAVSRNFNMGSAFGEGGTLKVKAVGADLAESFLYPVNFDVIPPPQGILPILLSHDPSSATLKYVTPSITREYDPEVPEDEQEEEMSIEEGTESVDDDEIPLFKDEKFKFGGTFEASAEVLGDGTARGPFFEATADKEGEIEKQLKKKKTRIAGMAVNLSASGQVDWDWSEDLNRWQPGGWIDLGADVSANVPPNPHYIVFWVVIVPVPVYFRGTIELSASAHLEIIDWLAAGQPEWNATIALDPFPYAEAMMGVGIADTLAAEGYLGGGARIILIFPQEDPVDTLQLFLTGGVRIVVLGFRKSWPLLEYTWDIHEGRWKLEPGEPIFELIPRDYLTRDGGYAVFVANRYGGGSRDIVNEEIPIQLNVFGQSTPDLAAVSDDLLTVWVYDDPVRTATNRTEIVFSKYDSVSELWTEPVAVVDDGTADFHPQIAALPNGDALLAWENVNEVLIEAGEPGDPCLTTCETECVDPESPECLQCLNECKYEELKGKTEIAVTHYDGVTQTWDTQAILTSNGFMDRSPRVATASDGTALLAWVSNATNDPLGTPDHPNNLHYATFDDATWSTAADVTTSGVPSVIKSALAYKGAEGVLLFTGDTDGDDQTPGDRELYAVQYDGLDWGPVLQLTDDPDDPNDPDNPPIEDANPQVAYDVNGDLLLVWYRGGDLVMATDLMLTDQQTIVDRDGGASSGAADFRLANGLAGQISLVWQDASEDRVDMWSAIYDPTLQAWAKPQRLTTDNTMEHAMAPVYDATGDVLVLYDKVQTSYETREVQVGGEIIQVDNVPVLDQTDLYLLRHIVGGDLAANSNGLVLAPPNPVAGQTAAITAVVKNLGDVAAPDIDIAFYDGDPAGAGVLIDVTTHGGPLVGGDEAEVSVDWLVPSSTSSHDIYVVVDPDFEQEDRDRNNNTATLFGVMKPDLTVESIQVQAAGNDRIITTRVLNASGLATSNIDLFFRRDADDGTLLQSFVVTDPIVPGAFVDVSWVWEDIAPIPGGEIEVYAIVDEAEAIDEFDEDNNVRSALVTNQPSTHPGDWDEDGDVDLDDFAEFPGCMSGPWAAEGFVMPSQDCLDVFDLDADADVDLKDFAGFQRRFGGGQR